MLPQINRTLSSLINALAGDRNRSVRHLVLPRLVYQ